MRNEGVGKCECECGCGRDLTVRAGFVECESCGKKMCPDCCHYKESSGTFCCKECG